MPAFPKILSLLLVTCLTLATTAAEAHCPFCVAVSQTFTEEINTMEVVVIAQLVEPAPMVKALPAGSEVPKAKFKAITVIKGESHLKPGDMISSVYFGEGKLGQPFMLMGTEPPKVTWSTPLQMNERSVKYILRLSTLPKSGAARLEFFQEHLEDQDEMLSRDAYDEFAKAPYKEVQDLKPKMKHDQLVAWIKDTDIPASRRRLYLTMLGVCGTEKDTVLLEQLLRSSDRKVKGGLDAMIACYLTLRGDEGMPLVEELYLKNKKAEYADTYAAIMALRFHGTETNALSRQRILEGMRHMLERTDLADLVIPDLARWEDWGQMDKLVSLFKAADEKSNWVKVPVINFLRACPLPEAKEALKELEKLDPATVKRANTFFPFGGTVATPAKS